MSVPPEHPNCECGRPLDEHTIPGFWFDDEIGHYFFISCAECQKHIKEYLSPWQLVKKWGLEGAEEMIEERVKMKWNRSSQCEHVFFQEVYK